MEEDWLDLLGEQWFLGNDVRLPDALNLAPNYSLSLAREQLQSLASKGFVVVVKRQCKPVGRCLRPSSLAIEYFLSRERCFMDAQSLH
jgi:hypothetical protein